MVLDGTWAFNLQTIHHLRHHLCLTNKTGVIKIKDVERRSDMAGMGSFGIIKGMEINRQVSGFDTF
jgi:hypothetical protein